MLGELLNGSNYPDFKLDWMIHFGIVYRMNAVLPDLSNPSWTTELVQLLVGAMDEIIRLDERVSASSLAAPWSLRASWSGYARALQAQGAEIEEIDIFSHECGIPLPSREPIFTLTDPFAALPAWRAGFVYNGRRHWTDGLEFAFSPPQGWANRPALLRALDLTARQARAIGTADAWLGLPLLLQRLGVTRNLLPNLVVGDKAIRLAPRDSRIISRYFRALRLAASDGLAVIESMERDRLQAAAALAQSFRPGNLMALSALRMHLPVLSPTRVAAELGLTLSGAGKLLARAQELGLIVQAQPRHNWRVYLNPDLAVRFGFAPTPRGRPPSPPPVTQELDSMLAAFDAEMAEFEKLPAFEVRGPSENTDQDHME